MLIHPYQDEIDRQRRREAREERACVAGSGSRHGRPPRRIRRAVGRSIDQDRQPSGFRPRTSTGPLPIAGREPATQPEI